MKPVDYQGIQITYAEIIVDSEYIQLLCLYWCVTLKFIIFSQYNLFASSKSTEVLRGDLVKGVSQA